MLFKVSTLKYFPELNDVRMCVCVCVYDTENVIIDALASIK